MKVIGDPVTPLEDAVIVAGAPNGGRVMLVEAVPSARVVELVGLANPPAGATDQATVRPDTGLPLRVMITRSGLGSTVPSGADWASPLVLAFAITGDPGGGGGGGAVPPLPQPRDSSNAVPAPIVIAILVIGISSMSNPLDTGMLKLPEN